MARKIGITKVSSTTVVRTWDDSDASKVKVHVFNHPCNYSKNEHSVTLNSIEYPKIVFTFDNINDNLGAADLDAYVELMITSGFFAG